MDLYDLFDRLEIPPDPQLRCEYLGRLLECDPQSINFASLNQANITWIKLKQLCDLVTALFETESLPNGALPHGQHQQVTPIQWLHLYLPGAGKTRWALIWEGRVDLVQIQLNQTRQLDYQPNLRQSLAAVGSDISP